MADPHNNESQKTSMEVRLATPISAAGALRVARMSRQNAAQQGSSLCLASKSRSDNSAWQRGSTDASWQSQGQHSEADGLAALYDQQSHSYYQRLLPREQSSEVNNQVNKRQRLADGAYVGTQSNANDPRPFTFQAPTFDAARSGQLPISAFDDGVEARGPSQHFERPPDPAPSKKRKVDDRHQNLPPLFGASNSVHEPIDLCSPATTQPPSRPRPRLEASHAHQVRALERARQDERNRRKQQQLRNQEQTNVAQRTAQRQADAIAIERNAATEEELRRKRIAAHKVQELTRKENNTKRIDNRKLGQAAKKVAAQFETTIHNAGSVEGGRAQHYDNATRAAETNGPTEDTSMEVDHDPDLATSIEDENSDAVFHDDYNMRCNFPGCSVTFTRGLTRQQHVTLQHPGWDPPPYQCHVCFRAYKLELPFRAHYAKAHPEVEPRVVLHPIHATDIQGGGASHNASGQDDSVIDKESFAPNQDLDAINSKICHECFDKGATGAIFLTTAARNEHQLEVHPGSQQTGTAKELQMVDGTRLPCAILGCPRAYGDKQSLVRHVEQDHPMLANREESSFAKRPESFPCKVSGCGNMLACPDAVRTHMKKVHGVWNAATLPSRRDLDRSMSQLTERTRSMSVSSVQEIVQQPAPTKSVIARRKKGWTQGSSSFTDELALSRQPNNQTLSELDKGFIKLTRVTEKQQAQLNKLGADKSIQKRESAALVKQMKEFINRMVIEVKKIKSGANAGPQCLDNRHFFEDMQREAGSIVMLEEEYDALRQHEEEQEKKRQAATAKARKRRVKVLTEAYIKAHGEYDEDSRNESVAADLELWQAARDKRAQRSSGDHTAQADCSAISEEQPDVQEGAAQQDVEMNEPETEEARQQAVRRQAMIEGLRTLNKDKKDNFASARNRQRFSETYEVDSDDDEDEDEESEESEEDPDPEPTSGSDSRTLTAATSPDTDTEDNASIDNNNSVRPSIIPQEKLINVYHVLRQEVHEGKASEEVKMTSRTSLEEANNAATEQLGYQYGRQNLQIISKNAEMKNGLFSGSVKLQTENGGTAELRSWVRKQTTYSGQIHDGHKLIIKAIAPSSTYVMNCKWTKGGVPKKDESRYFTQMDVANDAALKRGLELLTPEHPELACIDAEDRDTTIGGIYEETVAPHLRGMLAACDETGGPLVYEIEFGDMKVNTDVTEVTMEGPLN